MNLLRAIGLLVDLFTRAHQRGDTAHTAAVLMGGLLGGVGGFFAIFGAFATAGPDGVTPLVYIYIALPLLFLVTAAALLSSVWPNRVWQWTVILAWGYVVFGLVFSTTGTAVLVVAVLGAVGVAAGAGAGPVVRSLFAAGPRPRSRR